MSSKLASSARRFVRKARDNPLVLATLVAGLKALRSVGLLRSRRIYSHVPYRGVVRVECQDQCSFLIESKGHNIENGLFWEGLRAHEPETMRLWVNEARHAGVVLDIGANSGVFALAAAAVGARAVHAFEPVPRLYGILSKNLSLNPAFPVHAWAKAVGQIDGVATLFDPGGDAPTSASLSEEFVRKRRWVVEGTDVDVVSIDSFCDEQRVSEVGLIKIDVEGYEAQALKGMQRLVAESRPVIFMEVLEGSEQTLQSLVVALWPGMFEWVSIDEGGEVSRNVLLRPRSRLPRSSSV